MRTARGFSLIELVTVLVLIGALAVFAVPRLNTSGFAGYSFHEELLAAVRHAQKTATASRCEIEVAVNASSGYTVEYTGYVPPGQASECPSARTPVPAPGRSGALKRSPPSGVQITSGATFAFDEFGVLCDNAPDCDKRTSRVAIEINGRRDVIVEAFTGYVHD